MQANSLNDGGDERATGLLGAEEKGQGFDPSWQGPAGTTGGLATRARRRVKKQTSQGVGLSEIDHDSKQQMQTNEDARDERCATALSQSHPHAAHHKLDEHEKKLMSSYESLDYDIIRNEVKLARDTGVCVCVRACVVVCVACVLACVRRVVPRGDREENWTFPFHSSSSPRFVPALLSAPATLPKPDASFLHTPHS